MYVQCVETTGDFQPWKYTQVRDLVSGKDLSVRKVQLIRRANRCLEGLSKLSVLWLPRIFPLNRQRNLKVIGCSFGRENLWNIEHHLTLFIIRIAIQIKCCW